MIFCFRILAIFALAASFSTGVWGQTAPAAPANAQADPAYPFIQQALQSLKAGDTAAAADLLDKGIAANPHSITAHVLRGSIDASKRLLPQAEAQFLLAEADAPSNLRIKFFLADIKMSEGDYPQARALYAALVKTPGQEDFVAYKVFLCDLMANQTELAARELAAFRQSPPQPSYYFANAAWYVTRKDSASAKKWLDEAATTFPMPKNAPYAQALQNLGFLPLPAN